MLEKPFLRENMKNVKIPDQFKSLNVDALLKLSSNRFSLDIYHDKKRDTDFDEKDLSTNDLTDIFKEKIVITKYSI